MLTRVMTGLVTMVLLTGWALPATAAEKSDLDKAFNTLKTYDWGQDRSPLQAIDKAVAESHGKPECCKKLEARLAAVLKTNAPMAAKDFVCRKLSLIGTAACVPAVAPLLCDQKLSHMARYALERIPAPEAVAAMRDALPKVKGRQKVGVINSLGVRRCSKAVALLIPLLQDSDKEIAAAAAAALGSIGNADAAKALLAFQKKAPKELSLPLADALLTAADHLLDAGNKAQAIMIYTSLMKSNPPKHVKVAATRGMLATKKK